MRKDYKWKWIRNVWTLSFHKINLNKNKPYFGQLWKTRVLMSYNDNYIVQIWNDISTKNHKASRRSFIYQPQLFVISKHGMN